MTTDNELLVWVKQESARNPILSTRYFRLLESGTTRELFVETQSQFYFAVRYFSRPLAALTARMPSSALRQGLIHNLTEEHGGSEEQPASMDPALAHDRTFARFLGTLGIDGATLGGLREDPAVRAFNNALMGVCLMEPIRVAFGCLGVIEYSFAGISAFIGDVVVRHGWISRQELVHYALHAEIDERHAADFFKIVEQDWLTQESACTEIQDGVRLGLHIFGRLYEDLLVEAETRP